jgi:hypothetical protein
VGSLGARVTRDVCDRLLGRVIGGDEALDAEHVDLGGSIAASDVLRLAPLAHPLRLRY